MSKEEFLRQLEANLMIGKAEKDEVMCYYSEYFEEAGPENEQAVLGELGDPVALARKLTAECKEDMTGAAGTAGDNAETGNSGKVIKPTRKRGTEVLETLEMALGNTTEIPEVIMLTVIIMNRPMVPWAEIWGQPSRRQFVQC